MEGNELQIILQHIDDKAVESQRHFDEKAEVTNRNMQILAEGLRSDIERVAEGVANNNESLERFKGEVRSEFAEVKAMIKGNGGSRPFGPLTHPTASKEKVPPAPNHLITQSPNHELRGDASQEIAR